MRDAYRIKEATVEVCNGHRCWHERRFIALRRVRLFRIFSFWWPVVDADWRRHREGAVRDIERDAELRQPSVIHETRMGRAINQQHAVLGDPENHDPYGPQNHPVTK